MVHKTRDITETKITAFEKDEPIDSKPAQPMSGVQNTHPDPEREKHLASLLEKAWPKIKASMYYLRDR